MFNLSLWWFLHVFGTLWKRPWMLRTLSGMHDVFLVFFPQLDWIYLDTMSKLQEATAAPTLWLNRWSYHKVAGGNKNAANHPHVAFWTLDIFGHVEGMLQLLRASLCFNCTGAFNVHVYTHNINCYISVCPEMCLYRLRYVQNLNMLKIWRICIHPIFVYNIQYTSTPRPA